MIKVRIINKENFVFECLYGKFNLEYNKTAKATANCAGYCYFCTYYKGQHWLDDWVKCNFPINIKPGDKYRITKSYTVQPVRKYTRKKRRK